MRLLLLFLLPMCALAQSPNYVRWVNPFIGTGGHGHTFPGASLPFGMVQLSPDTRIDGSWDGCSGYHQSDTILYGFSHTHLSGTGCSDYGDIMLMPTYSASMSNKDYASRFSHADEKATAGYYSVMIDQRSIQAEMTATTRVGLHRYTFIEGGNVQMVLDLTHRDKLLEGQIRILNDTTIEGMRRSAAWASNQTLYYRIVFSKPMVKNQKQAEEKALFYFNMKSHEQLLVKVAISSVDAEGAKRNMNAELQHWDFDKVKKAAEAAWNRELSKIEIKAKDARTYEIFYTALYHTMLQPNIYNDVDGQYRGRDGAVHKAEGFDYYSVFSLWDTYRAAHPLYTIIDRKRTLDFIKTFLAQYQQGGRLPVWELACNETDCMIGYHSVSVIADALAKGIDGFDVRLAMEAMEKSANSDKFGVPAYSLQHFLSVDDEHESVSKTLEYAYDDWCIAQVAKHQKDAEKYEEYMRRALSYRNVFDTKTGFMRPLKNGDWLSPFEPREVNNHFTEANSWQYSFYAPQDISGLMDLMKLSSGLGAKLDSLFNAPTQTTGRQQSDITGLIGQYAHGNEPSHHIAYLYNFAGQPQKTQSRVYQILTEMYDNKPDGLIGNEDCGQMSAWYVLSAMGFYPVTPGLPEYIIGSPLLEEAKINLENGKSFVINTSKQNEGQANKYIYSANLNGGNYTKTYLKHSDIANGGTMQFVMSANANSPAFGKAAEDAPVSKIELDRSLPIPLIKSSRRVFNDTIHVYLHSNDAQWRSLQNDMASVNTKLYYTTDGSYPSPTSAVYSGKPIVLDKSATIWAMQGNELAFSPMVKASFHKLPNNWSVELKYKTLRQYTAGGAGALVDGIRGDENWRKGEWQGYQATDCEALIDFKKKIKISKLGAGFLQDTRSWILMPKQVIFELSKDGKSFVQAGVIDNTLPADDYKVQITDLEISIKATTARYLRVRAVDPGPLPSWHEGFGDAGIIFIDEIWAE